MIDLDINEIYLNENNPSSLKTLLERIKELSCVPDIAYQGVGKKDYFRETSIEICGCCIEELLENEVIPKD